MPETGREIWVKDVGHTPSTRGIAYWPGTDGIPPQLVFGTGDGSSLLISLDAKTGEFTQGFGQGGKVDLRQGVGEKFPKLRVALSSPPAIYKHLAITGNHSQEAPSLGPCGRRARLGSAHGQARLDVPHDSATGRAESRRVARTISGSIAPARTRGDSSRSTKTAASRMCRLGTPATDFYGGDRLGSNLYGSSLLALDADDRQAEVVLSDHASRQLGLRPERAAGAHRRQAERPHDSGRRDLYEAGPAVHLRSRDRQAGVRRRRAAGLSDNPIPGDEYWPTQPFPLKPPPIARMTFAPHEIAKVTPEHEAYCKGLLELEGGAMTGGPYAQYGPKLRVIFPGWTGGGNWNGSAFNPDLGYLFFPTQDHGMLNKMVKSERGREHVDVRSGPDKAPPMLGTNFWDGRKGLAVSAAAVGRARRRQRQHRRHRLARAARLVRRARQARRACDRHAQPRRADRHGGRPRLHRGVAGRAVPRVRRAQRAKCSGWRT